MFVPVSRPSTIFDRRSPRSTGASIEEVIFETSHPTGVLRDPPRLMFIRRADLRVRPCQDSAGVYGTYPRVKRTRKFGFVCQGVGVGVLCDPHRQRFLIRIRLKKYSRNEWEGRRELWSNMGVIKVRDDHIIGYMFYNVKREMASVCNRLISMTG